MSTRQIAYVAVLAALYVVLGQVVKFLPNPMVSGAIIALNMVVVVISGILLGPRAGALVGLIGTGVNGFFTPAGNAYERFAISPAYYHGTIRRARWTPVSGGRLADHPGGPRAEYLGVHSGRTASGVGYYRQGLHLRSGV